MAAFLLSSLILLSFFTVSAPVLPSQTISDAVEILSDSGYVSMSLTLQLISKSPMFQSPAATIFAPSDEAFKKSGQPTIGLLQYHFSPLKFSLQNLMTLPFGTKIPTFYPNHSLIVTSSGSDGQISLNNVRINGSAIFDVGSLIVFGIDEFFDPSFQVSNVLPPAPTPSSDLECLAPVATNNFVFGDDSLARASSSLIFRGYTTMASFLDMQFLGQTDKMKLTVFAPVDESLAQYSGNFSQYSTIFRRHILPCRFLWIDLVDLDGGARLRTFSDGFTVSVTRSGDVLVLNGVPVVFPDLYVSDSLVVHGLRQMIPYPSKPQPISGDSVSEVGGSSSGSLLFALLAAAFWLFSVLICCALKIIISIEDDSTSFS